MSLERNDKTLILDEVCTGVLFRDYDTYMMDIDLIFQITNKTFAKLLVDIGLNIDFDFSNRDNKKLYTHAFLLVLCDTIKNRQDSNKLCFYSNTITKDVFRNQLVKKVKTIFGFKILEDVVSLGDIATKIDQRDPKVYTTVEIFLSQENKPKPFKKIKQYLDKTGLRSLHNEYFEDLQNKILVCIC